VCHCHSIFKISSKKGFWSEFKAKKAHNSSITKTRDHKNSSIFHVFPLSSVSLLANQQTQINRLMLVSRQTQTAVSWRVVTEILMRNLHNELALSTIKRSRSTLIVP
jgi:hypothetical protein